MTVIRERNTFLLSFERKNCLPDLVRKAFCIIHGNYFRPSRLINSNAVKDRGKFMSVLCHVNLFWISSEDVDTTFLKSESDVLGQLSYIKMFNNELSSYCVRVLTTDAHNNT